MTGAGILRLCRMLASRPESWYQSLRGLFLVPFALVLVALAVFGHTLGGYFVGDDFGYVSLYHAYPPDKWLQLFVREWSQGMWGFALPELRPVAAFSFILDGWIWGGNAFGYRLSNLALHVACSGLVFHLARNLPGVPTMTAAGAALLFSVHPAHVEPIVWITGRVDLLPTLFCLGSLLAFMRYRRTGGFTAAVGSGALYAGAIFSKEYALVLPLLAGAYDTVYGREFFRRAGGSGPKLVRILAPYAFFILALLIYYVCRRIALGGMGGTPPGASGLPFAENLARRQIYYWSYLLSPLDAGMETGAWIRWRDAAPTWLLCAIAFLPLGLVGALAARRAFGRPVLFGGVLWFLITTLPFLVTYASARHLYLASSRVLRGAGGVARGSARSFPAWRRGFRRAHRASCCVVGLDRHAKGPALGRVGPGGRRSSSAAGGARHAHLTRDRADFGCAAFAPRRVDAFVVEPIPI